MKTTTKIHIRRDTAGDLAPIIDNGKVYPYIGTVYDQHQNPIVTAWGENYAEVAIELNPYEQE